MDSLELNSYGWSDLFVRLEPSKPSSLWSQNIYMIVVLFMCLSLLLVTGIGIDSGPSLAALLLAPLPLSAFFAPHRPFFVFWGLLPFLTRIWYLQLSRKKLVLNMKYVCFYFFRRRFWVQIGDRRRADIAAHPGSGCHHCTLHTAVSSLQNALSSLHIAHYTAHCHHCTLHTALSSL